MSQTPKEVTVADKVDNDRIPECCNEGAIFITHLERNGVLSKIGERFQIYRQGGYPGIDLFVFFLLFYASHLRTGIKDFARRLQPWSQRIAALAGRRRLASPASLSRLLGAVDSDVIAQLNPWLLIEGTGACSVLAQANVRSSDATGKSWHIFDIDDTSTVFRRRGLPDRSGYPVARRRSREAKSGYFGRKRGDVKFSRTTLAHAGSGLWAGAWMAPGNGRWREHSNNAIEAIVKICRGIGHAPEHALLRADGAGGNYPFAAACEARGVRYLARSAHYAFLDKAEVRAHMSEAVWTWVPDGMSGPKRQATDLGSFRMYDSAHDASKEPGSLPPHADCRLVAARYPAGNVGDGHVIDGWRYELFVCNLPVDGWPAADIVTTYMERSAIENRFGLEDRELNLDRAVSYHVDGQNIANLIGLFVWNLRVCLGTIAAPQDNVISEPVIRFDDISIEAVPVPALESEDKAPVTEIPHAPITLTANDCTEENRRALAAVLAPLPWESLLARAPGWHWNPAVAGLLCPVGVAAPLASVRKDAARHTGQLRFASPSSACNGCALKTTCIETTDEQHTRKQITITVPKAVAVAANERLIIFRTKKAPRVRKKRIRTSGWPPSIPLTERWTPPVPDSDTSGLWAIMTPTFLPALAKRAFVESCIDVEIRVSTNLAEATTVSLLREDQPSARHARKSWNARSAYNRASSRAMVTFALGARSAGLRTPAILPA